MSDKQAKLVSIVIPCYNEAANIQPVYDSLMATLATLSDKHEIVYVDDGSTDGTLEKLQAIAKDDSTVHVVALSRNFGKEIATTAGIHAATGDAIICLDGDGQHPVELIPTFIEKWQHGARVVVGVRKANSSEGPTKKYGSKLFYKLFNTFTGTSLVPGSTDFRLIDKSVQTEFKRLTERNRITRGLIDWLGFKQKYVYFSAHARTDGQASYSVSKLFELALNSFVSLSLKPLYFSFYMGLIILPLSIALAVFSAVEMLIGDPMMLNITGTAYLVILALFLLGTVLISQGITALYLSHIHAESQNRPLYIVDEAESRNR